MLQRFSLLFSHFICTYLLVRQAFNIFNIVSHVEIAYLLSIGYSNAVSHSFIPQTNKKITSHFPKEWIVFPHLCHISKILPNFHTCQYHISLIVSYIQKIVIFPYLPISYFHTCVIFPYLCHVSKNLSYFHILISCFHTCVT